MQLNPIFRKYQRAFCAFLVLLLILTTSGLTGLVQRADAATWGTQKVASVDDLYAVDTDGNEHWLAVGNSSSLVTSSDGKSWTRVSPSGFSGSATDLKYCGTTWVLVGLGGMIATSGDSGATWSQKTVGTSDFYGVACNGSTIVAVGSQGTVVSSTNGGTSWTSQTSQAGSKAIYGVSYVNGEFIAVGEQGGIYTSPTGVTWTDHSYPAGTSFTLEKVAYANGVYVAVGYDTDASSNFIPVIQHSGDGVSWTAGTAPDGLYGLYGLAVASTYKAGKFVAVGDNGTILSSEDGITWGQETSGTSDLLLGAVYYNNQFVAVGHYGRVLSEDGSPRTDATLKSMVLGTGSITFDPSTTNYSVSIPYTTSMNVTPTLNDTTGATLAGTNNGVSQTVYDGATNTFNNLHIGTNTINFTVTAQDGTTQKTYTLTVNVAPANADLSALSVTGGTMSPTFASGTTGYTVTTPNGASSIQVTATPVDSAATMKLSVNGATQTTLASNSATTASGLQPGTNTVAIEVDAKDNTTKKTYTLTVNVPQTNNANLSNLAVSGVTLNPTFASNTTDYTVTEANGTSQVQVTATSADPAATLKVAVNGGTQTVMTSGSAFAATGLHTGTNMIAVEVTSQDGTVKKTYNLTVTVAQSSNADLNGLTVSGGTLNETFSSSTQAYTVSAAHGTTSVDVTARTAVNTASMTVAVNNGTPTTLTSASAYTATGLHTGSNTIAIEVTAENGTSKKTYTLTVTVAQSANADLSGLNVSGGTMNEAFDANTQSYTVDAPNGTSAVNVTATTADTTATLKVKVNSGTAATATSGSAFTASGLHTGSNTIVVTVTAENGTSTKDYTLTVTVAQSANADLSNLTVNGGTITPSFDPSTTDYVVDVPSTHSVDITPTVADSTATVTVDGNTVVSGSTATLAVTPGDTKLVPIIVTAENGTTKQYNLSVHVAKSSIADLSNLTVSGGTLNETFDPSTQSYTADAPHGTSAVQVTATTADTLSSMTVTVNSGTTATMTSGSAYTASALHTGINTIVMEVTAQDGTTKDYTLTVTVAKSADADLSGLSVSGVTLNETFDPSTQSYTVNEPNGTNQVQVTATKDDINATMTATVNSGTPAAMTSGSSYTATGLHSGSNTIDVKVTAENGTTTKDYTLTVEVAKSTNADLRNLTVAGGTLQPTFASANTGYSVDLPGTHSVQITPTVDDSTATVTVDGQATTSGTAATVAVTPGSSQDISIIVTAENGTTKEYKLTVNVAKSTNADLNALTVSGGTLNGTFDANTQSYTVSAPNGTSAVLVTATTADDTSTMKVAVNGGTQTTMASGSAYTASGMQTGTNSIVIEVDAQDGTTTKTYTLTVNVAKSANADLNGLTVNGGTLNETFDANTQSYTVSAPNGTTHVDVTATVADAAHATMSVSVNGGASEALTSGSAYTATGLHSGSNTVVITVTAEDGISTKDYTITVNVAKSTNADLSNLTVTGGTLTPDFATATTSYSVDLPSTHSVGITPTVDDSTATVSVDGNTVTSGTEATVVVAPGSSRDIPIIVTAESGATKTYTVTVNVAPSTNADLLNLTLSGGTMPAFDGSTDYTATVSHNATDVSVTPTVADDVSTLTVNGADATSGTSTDVTLDAGDTTVITIVVTPQSGAPKTYTITITRLALSQNADLSNLQIAGHALTPSFTSSEHNYTATVANAVDQVQVTPTLSDDQATMAVEVNSVAVTATSGNPFTANLNVGANTIAVQVTAKDGVTVTTYTITVTRSDVTPPSTNDATLSDLTITPGTLSPVFAPSQMQYSANVASNVATVDLTAVANDASATIKIRDQVATSGTPVTLSLTNGVNTFHVDVTAADGVTKETYTVSITRAHKPTPPPPPVDWINGTVHVENGNGGGSSDENNVTKNIGKDLKLSGELYDANGQKLNLPDIQFDANNNFKLPRIAPGTYHMAMYVNAPNGQKLAGQSVTLTVTSDKVSATIDLIDPFGVVSDAMTKQPIEGVKVSLYWADTELNRSLGRTPGAQVVLPELPDMMPNQNHNSQTTNSAGQYGWMVFPSGDYYIIAEKAGYATYDSRTDKRDEAQGDTSYIRNGLIHVGQTVVQMNFSMQAKVIDGGTRTPYIFGTPNGTFQPNKGITRAELAAILSRVLPTDGSTSTSTHFRDVSSSNWAAKSIADIYERGLMVGYPDGGFHPNDLVTRAQLAAILAKLKQLPPAQSAAFTDIEGNWAQDAILRVKEAGYVSGYPDGTYRPNQAITRLETVIIINKLLGWNTQNVEGPQKWSDVSPSMQGYAEIMEASVAHEYELYANGLEVWK